MSSAGGSTVRLFNPRLDDCSIHFRVELDSGEIVGVTPTGALTVTRLRINSPSQIAARRHWMSLGLFP